MYLSTQAVLVRNVCVSLVNGSVTLIILLIAPLGLLAVITNTLLITITTYITLTVADRVIVFLQREQQAELLPKHGQFPLQQYKSSHINRRR